MRKDEHSCIDVGFIVYGDCIAIISIFLVYKKQLLTKDEDVRGIIVDLSREDMIIKSCLRQKEVLRHMKKLIVT